MTAGIYQIYDKITSDYYIGSSIDINKIFNRHKSDLKLNKHKWVSHVCSLLDLNKGSISKHGYKKDENKIFYDFFCVK